MLFLSALVPGALALMRTGCALRSNDASPGDFRFTVNPRATSGAGYRVIDSNDPMAL